MTAAPKLHRLGPGVYESADKRVTLYQIPGVYPPAWNVEWTTDFQNDLIDMAYAMQGAAAKTIEGIAYTNIVDGARSYRDAKALYEDAWPDVAAELRRFGL